VTFCSVHWQKNNHQKSRKENGSDFFHKGCFRLLHYVSKAHHSRRSSDQLEAFRWPWLGARNLIDFQQQNCFGRFQGFYYDLSGTIFPGILLAPVPSHQLILETGKSVSLLLRFYRLACRFDTSTIMASGANECAIFDDNCVPLVLALKTPPNPYSTSNEHFFRSAHMIGTVGPLRVNHRCHCPT